MCFELSDEQRELRIMIRKFVEREILPIAQEVDESQRFPEENFKKLGELGILGMSIPQEYGGGGMPLSSCAIVCEELAYGCASTTLSVFAHMMLCANTLARVGSPEQCSKYLPHLASGEKLGAFALTEPEAGSDALNIQTTATRSGGEYILNGSKTFITNAPVAAIFIVFACTDKSKGAKGISAFVVEKGMDGLSLGPKMNKMGMRASPTGEMFFDNCKVPAENLLGEEGGGAKYALATLDFERALAPAFCIGLARAALDRSIEYSRKRVQFGRPIAKFQAVQFMLADMATNIAAARALMQEILHKKERGERISKEAAMAKLFSARMAVKAALDAIQIHGGYGYMKEYGVERLLRDAKLIEIGGGTNEIQQLVIAREILGMA